MLMLKGHKEEVQSSIDRAARETRDCSAASLKEDERSFERERFQQSLLEESRRQYDDEALEVAAASTISMHVVCVHQGGHLQSRRRDRKVAGRRARYRGSTCR